MFKIGLVSFLNYVIHAAKTAEEITHPLINYYFQAANSRSQVFFPNGYYFQ